MNNATAASVATRAAPKVEHPTVEALSMFVRNPAAIAGMVMLFVVLVVSIAGPWFFPADPFEIKAAPLTPRPWKPMPRMSAGRQPPAPSIRRADR